MVWYHPTFPTILVAYDRTSDFFFSGHTGHTLLLLLEVYALNMPKWIKIFMKIELAFMIFMLISSRVHYTLDVIGGFIFGYLSFYLSVKYVYYYDYLLSMPSYAFRKLKGKSIKNL
jgi:membrane-associated phospholipid phosphatase